MSTLAGNQFNLSGRPSRDGSFSCAASSSSRSFSTEMGTSMAADAPTPTCLDSALDGNAPEYVFNDLASRDSPYDAMRVLPSTLSFKSTGPSLLSANGLTQENATQLDDLLKWGNDEAVQQSTSSTGNFWFDSNDRFVAGLWNLGLDHLEQGHVEGTADAQRYTAPYSRPFLDPLRDQYFIPAPGADAALPLYSPRFNLDQTETSSPYELSPFKPVSDGNSDTPGQRRGDSVSTNTNLASESVKQYDGCKEQKRGSACPLCGGILKDIEAHLLTHLDERPQKCPIETCKYYIRGFARKQDRNRHILTHFKNTMECGFCSDGGPEANKMFNRADVFKRHLITVHGVGRPNRSRPASGSGAKMKHLDNSTNTQSNCNACSQTFYNPQNFYEHLDQCLRRSSIKARHALVERTDNPSKNDQVPETTEERAR